MVPINLPCDYFAGKFHGYNRRNLCECVLLLLLFIVLFCWNNRGRPHYSRGYTQSFSMAQTVPSHRCSGKVCPTSTITLWSPCSLQSSPQGEQAVAGCLASCCWTAVLPPVMSASPNKPKDIAAGTGRRCVYRRGMLNVLQYLK